MTTPPTSHIATWLSDLFTPVASQLPGEHTARLPYSSAHRSLFNPQNYSVQSHRQWLSNQVPIHAWVERVHMEVKCLAQEHNVTPPQLRVVPGTSRSSFDRSNHCATTSRLHLLMFLPTSMVIKARLTRASNQEVYDETWRNSTSGSPTKPRFTFL